MDGWKHYLRLILNIVIPLTGWMLLVLLGPRLLKFFIPFVIGWILALIANPLVRFFEKRLKIVRKHSSVIIVIVVLSALIGILYLLVAKLASEMTGLVKSLPDIYESMLPGMEKIWANIDQILSFLPENIQENWTSFRESLGELVGLAVQKVATPTVEAAGSVAKRIPNALVYSIITILSSYFFIVEREELLVYWKKMIPEDKKKYFTFIKNDAKYLIGGYFSAQFRIMFVVALVLAAGFLVLGVDYGLLLSVLIAMLDFLPIFGTGTVLIPWALFKLVTGEYAFAAGMALLYVLTQTVRQIIQPKIVGDSMGLPPFTTLFLLYVGFKISGIAGMILAVPMGLLVMNLYKYGAFQGMLDSLKELIHDVNEFRREK